MSEKFTFSIIDDDSSDSSPLVESSVSYDSFADALFAVVQDVLSTSSELDDPVTLSTCSGNSPENGWEYIASYRSGDVHRLRVEVQ